MLLKEEHQLINKGGPRVGEPITLQLPMKEVIWQEHQMDAKVLGSPLVTRKVPGEQEEVQRERQRGVRNHRLSPVSPPPTTRTGPPEIVPSQSEGKNGGNEVRLGGKVEDVKPLWNANYTSFIL